MMRDIQADWKHWTRVERILAAVLIASAVSFVIGSVVLGQT